jgi:fructose-specific phosphotransferase system component IIB
MPAQIFSRELRSSHKNSATGQGLRRRLADKVFAFDEGHSTKNVGSARRGQGDFRPKQGKASVMVDLKVKDAKVQDALDHVRAATQELHGAISDAAAKRGGAVKADLEALSLKAKGVTESVKGSIGAQSEATKKALAEAGTHLDATQKHIAESLKSSGQAFQNSVRQALADARAAAQKVSEAVAAKRSAASKQSTKK